MRNKISQGAEAVIYKDAHVIIKDRVKKNYRITELDDRLRKARTRREAKVLERLHAKDFNSPAFIDMDDKDMQIRMQFIDGPKVRDILNKKNCKELCEEIGAGIAFLHKNNIMHADLTTSNMILEKHSNKVHFIDFGLSFFSDKLEDRAVDLHLLRQAFESKHSDIWEDCFKHAVDGYKKNCSIADEVLARLEVVEKRGRYKVH